MLESAPIGFLYSLAKDTIGLLGRRRHHISPADSLKSLQKWKPEFERHIRETHDQKLRRDVIVRDVRRIADYPDVTRNHRKKGTSAWFRVELVDTYHRGIELGLRFGELMKVTFEDGSVGWRYLDHEANEAGDIKAYLIGKVPYDRIEHVDWEGDEYYNYPHIYCHFDFKGEPYEELVFCQERERPHGLPPFYMEVAPYKQVRELSRSTGLATFG
jgi:hypothetical protein